jgi:hypothetical protein
MVMVPEERFEHGACAIELTVTDGKLFSSTVGYRLMGPGSHQRDRKDQEHGGNQ